MGIVNLIMPFRQKPVVALDYNKALANGETYSTKNIPCVGFTMLYGMLYTTQEISLIIEQGTKENPLTYRSNDSYDIAMLETFQLEIPVVGKFIRISIVNGSGSSANIESFFCLRGVE